MVMFVNNSTGSASDHLILDHLIPEVIPIPFQNGPHAFWRRCAWRTLTDWFMISTQWWRCSWELEKRFCC